MKVYPALEIQQGKSVKSLHGNLSDIVTVNEDAVEEAIRAQLMGFKSLDLLDVDGIKTGKPTATDTIQEIMHRTGLMTAVGGGIRSEEDADFWFDRGVSYIMIGQMVLTDPKAARRIFRKYPGQVLVTIDAVDDRVLYSGRETDADVKMIDLALRCEDQGAVGIIYTDVEEEHIQRGIDIDRAVDLAWALTIPLTVNASFAQVEDIFMLKNESGAGIEGVIVDPRLYDNYEQMQAFIDKMAADEPPRLPQHSHL